METNLASANGVRVGESRADEAPTRLTVEVQDDHLRSLCGSRSPIDSVAELIWNALDADARHVRVSLQENGLRGIDEIMVTDDGHGIPRVRALESFGSLGGSWKPVKEKTPGQRFYHGKHGRGRFKAFSLGDSVQWVTTYEENGALFGFEIRSTGSLRNFEVTPQRPSTRATGTRVTIRNLLRDFRSLRADDAVQRLAEVFALYLTQYPGIQVTYEGQRVDPAKVMVSRIALGDIVAEKDPTATGTLTVIEWTHETERSLYLCDEHGAALDETNVEIHAPGFNFTAYLAAARFRERTDVLVLADVDPATSPLIDTARRTLKDYFRKRAVEQERRLIDEWKAEHVYPYEGEPTSPLETAEREVFDKVALVVGRHLPPLVEGDQRNRRLTLNLLRLTLETSPTNLRRIIAKVLDLPRDKQDELAELLERITLPAIVAASRAVADRLEFLKGLEALVLSPDLRKVVRERKELHRILAEHTWVFGEEYNLSLSDQSLGEVLKRHLKLLGRPVEKKMAQVAVEGKKRGIVDLMLSRVIPLPVATERWHLVIELKRPNHALVMKDLDQIRTYARAVANDDRFRDTTTRWDFVLLASGLGDAVRAEAHQKDRKPGLATEDATLPIRVWVKTWGEVIQEATARLKFYQERLGYDPTAEQGVSFLRKHHKDKLPSNVQAELLDPQAP
jgi:hypothetical protein